MSDNKMVVINPNDEILFETYEDFKDAVTQINGFARPFLHCHICEMDIDFLCNDNGLNEPTGFDEKVNAISSTVHLSLSDKKNILPIYGSVVLLKVIDTPYQEDGKTLFYEKDYAPFTEKEAMNVGIFIRNIAKIHEDLINLFHQDFDNQKKEMSFFYKPDYPDRNR